MTPKNSQRSKLDMRKLLIGSTIAVTGIAGYEMLKQANSETDTQSGKTLQESIETAPKRKLLAQQNTGSELSANLAENHDSGQHPAGCGCVLHAAKVDKDVAAASVILSPELQEKLLSHMKGDQVVISLPGGGFAEGVVNFVQMHEGRRVAISGTLSAPQKGKFYFNEETMPGLAGGFSGAVTFDDAEEAYNVVTNAAGEVVLVEVNVHEVLCRSYTQRLDQEAIEAIDAEEEQPEAIAADHPTDVHIPDYQNGVIPLESLPGASAVVYLDFDGEEGPFLSWGDFDAASSGSSNTQIRDVWLRIAEDFAPFNINVTTDLAVYQAAPSNSRIQCIFTPTNDAAPGAGGVAYVGDFNRTNDRVCWCFYTSGKNAAEAGSHEIGHTLGLHHHGTSTQGYYGGHGSGDVGWAPIMGVGYYENLSQWSKGEYADANRSSQDDLSIINNNNNNVAYRTDDHGATLATASNLEISSDDSVANEGIIETEGDFDSFKFEVTAASSVSLTVETVDLGPNLDILAELVDSTDTVVASNNPDAGIDATISAAVTAGEYYLRVSGVGRGSVSGDGYSDYGSLGEYSVSGSVTNSIVPDRFSIAEGAVNTTSVGTVTPNNSHGANPLTFAITSGDSGGAFTISNTGEITVADATQIDYETLSTYYDDPATFDLSVSITDTVDSGLNETVRVVITITDVNEAPVFTSVATTLVLPERLANGTKIWQAEATDEDNYDGAAFSITAGNVAGHFAIDSVSGKVTVAGVTDAAVTSSYNLTITATDKDSLTDSVVLTVNLIDFDSQYTPGSASVVYYDGISGSTVADLTGDARYPSNPDSATSLAQFSHVNHGADYGSVIRAYLIPPATGSYTLWIASNDSSELYLSTDDDPGNKALIASVSGNTNIDEWTKYTSQESASVTLTAGQVYYIEALHKDSGGGADHLQAAWQGPGITQQLIDGIYLAPAYQNYAPTLVDQAIEFELDTSNGASVIAVEASDLNSGETVGSFTITGGNTNNAFAINASTGEITVANAAGLVKDSVVALQVQGTDNGTPALSDTATISITIKDFLVKTGFEVAENFTGYSTNNGGSLMSSTTDQLGAQWTTPNDARIANHASNTFEGEQYLVLGWETRPNAVEIDIPGTGHGVGNVKFHYAAFSSATDCDLTLYYRVDGGSWIQAWTSSMSGLNPNYQTHPWPEVSVDVNQGGDVDLKLEVSGTDKGAFIDAIEVLGYIDGTNPTAYDAQSQSTTAGSSSGGLGNSQTSDNSYQVLTESVSSGNPPSSRTSNLEHEWTFDIKAEGSAVNLEVEAFRSNDDAADTFIFAYSTDGTNYTDALTVSKTSDDDVKQTASLPSSLSGTVYIRVKDANPSGTSNNNSADALSVDYISLNVAPLNVAPSPADDSVNVAEDASIGTVIYTVDPVDTNGLDTHTFTITAGNSGNVFDIDSNGTITTLVALDHETTSQYVLTVEVTDNGDLAGTAEITVNVTDIAEAPVAANDSLTVDANASSTGAWVLSNDTINSSQSGSIVGFIESVALYDAGSSGSPQNPTTQGWTEGDSEDGDVTTGSATAQASVNDNGSGLDAWLITDNHEGGGFVSYIVTPTSDQTAAGIANGWVMDTKLRFADDFGDSNSTVLIYGDGVNRFVVWFDLDSNGDLTTTLSGAGGGTYTLSSGGTGTDAFHDISMRYDPGSGAVAFYVDGTRYDAGAWTGDNNTFRGVYFGNGSSGGQGSAAFHKVELSVFDTTATLASGATFTVSGGDVVFDPNGGYDSLEDGQSANESIDYYLSNGTGLFDSATLDVTINGVDDLPAFDSDPVVATGGALFEAYSDSLANYGGDPDDSVTYSKVSGPAWLSVASDGALSGTPTSSDGGLNTFTVQISDGKGNDVQTSLEITVTSTATLIDENFQSYDVENPSDFSESSVASGKWTSSNTSTNATRIFDTSNYGSTRLWICNVDGTSITSAGVTVGSKAHYAFSAVLLAETGSGTATVNAEYDLLVGQTAGTAVSVIGGPQAVVARGDAYITDDSKTDHVFNHHFQTASVNPGDQLFVRITRVSGGSWFGVDDVQLSLVGGNTAPVANDATFSVAENSADETAVGTVVATDVDTNDSVSFVITAGNGAGHFAIDASTGVITTTAASLDYETATSHVLTVIATDLSGESDDVTITVNVTDVTSNDDSDGDKLDDAWEATFYANSGTVNASDDTDGDGLTSFQEMVFGSDPTSANVTDDYVTQAIVDDAGTEKLEVKFRRPKNHADLDVIYQLESSTTLGNGVAAGDWASDATVTTSVVDDPDGVTEWVAYRFTLSAHSKCFIRMTAAPSP